MVTFFLFEKDFITGKKEHDKDRPKDKPCHPHGDNAAQEPDKHRKRVDLYPTPHEDRADINFRERRNPDVPEDEDEHESLEISDGKGINPQEDKDC